MKTTRFLFSFITLIIAANTELRAQYLFPAGTKLHISESAEPYSVKNVLYKYTHFDTVTYAGKKYNTILFPDYYSTSLVLRTDSNKLYQYVKLTNEEILLFDFNAQKGDSINIAINYTGNYKIKPYQYTMVKIDTIIYQFNFNNLNIKDSVKLFIVSGNLKTYNANGQEIGTHKFRQDYVEKLLKLETSYNSYFLGINIGSQGSHNYQLLRCVEFPNGESIKTEWWKSVQETFNCSCPCDSRHQVSIAEIDQVNKVSIYPNPTHQNFTINDYSGKLIVTNVLGQEVYHAEVENKQLIPVQDLDDGLYFIILPNENNHRLPLFINHSSAH